MVNGYWQVTPKYDHTKTRAERSEFARAAWPYLEATPVHRARYRTEAAALGAMAKHQLSPDVFSPVYGCDLPMLSF